VDAHVDNYRLKGAGTCRRLRSDQGAYHLKEVSVGKYHTDTITNCNYRSNKYYDDKKVTMYSTNKYALNSTDKRNYYHLYFPFLFLCSLNLVN
jgi:hypothetical protein